MDIQEAGLQRREMGGVDLLGEELVDDAPETINRSAVVGVEHAEVVIMGGEGERGGIDGGQQVHRDLIQD